MQSPVTLIYEMMSDTKYWESLSEEKKQIQLNRVISLQYTFIRLTHTSGYVHGIGNPSERKDNEQRNDIDTWLSSMIKDDDDKYIKSESFIASHGSMWQQVDVSLTDEESIFERTYEESKKNQEQR